MSSVNCLNRVEELIRSIVEVTCSKLSLSQVKVEFIEEKDIMFAGAYSPESNIIEFNVLWLEAAVSRLAAPVRKILENEQLLQSDEELEDAVTDGPLTMLAKICLAALHEVYHYWFFTKVLNLDLVNKVIKLARELLKLYNANLRESPLMEMLYHLNDATRLMEDVNQINSRTVEFAGEIEESSDVIMFIHWLQDRYRPEELLNLLRDLLFNTGEK